MTTGEKTASGGNPLFCVDLPMSLPLVASDKSTTMIIVGLLATGWWYFIAQIGWSSTQKWISRTAAGAGAVLIVFMCVIESVWMFREFGCCISHDPNLSVVDGIIYVLAITLLWGGIMSAVYSARAALGLNKN